MALTPNMNLLLPTVSVTIGPDWATELNDALDLVDSHNHTEGQGARVPSAAILINADLSFNTNYNLIGLRSLRLINESAHLALPTDINCIYVAGGELFYNDDLGNQVQLTLDGAVDTSSSGNITGMGATTASVVYTSVNSTFSFYSDTNEPANMLTGPISIGLNEVSPFTVRLIPSESQIANYDLTFPAAPPASDLPVIMDQDGILSASQITQAMIAVRTNGSSVAAGGIAFAGNSGSFSTSNTSYQNVTNQSTTLVSTGSPIKISLEAHPASAGSGMSIDAGAPGSVSIQILVDSVVQAIWEFAGTIGNTYPLTPSGICFTYPVSAGSHFIQLQAKTSSSSITVSIIGCRLVAYEL